MEDGETDDEMWDTTVREASAMETDIADTAATTQPPAPAVVRTHREWPPAPRRPASHAPRRASVYRAITESKLT